MNNKPVVRLSGGNTTDSTFEELEVFKVLKIITEESLSISAYASNGRTRIVSPKSLVPDGCTKFFTTFRYLSTNCSDLIT